MKCELCASEFDIRPEDDLFYAKMGVPRPRLCPPCRDRQRLSFYNQNTLYYRKCDLCGQNSLSIYHPDSKMTVYCPKCYWSDKWDPASYALEIDWDKKVIDQINELFKKVPDVGLVVDETIVNSDFNNGVGYLKNCYRCFESSNAEDCMYCESMGGSRDLVDCYDIGDSELSYYSINCYQCYNSQYLKDCSNCRDCYYCLNCTNCHDCFGCINSINKEYCWYGQQLTKREYQEKIKSVGLNSNQVRQELWRKAKKEWRSAIVRYATIKKSEDVTGDYIYNSQNIHESYFIIGAENIAYSFLIQVAPSKDCYDFSSFGGGNAELLYQAVNCGSGMYNCKFVSKCWANCSDLVYCLGCWQTKNSFGCVNTKKSKNCIFNKNYPEKEYQLLKEKLIKKMTAEGDYGEFFPSRMSPFGFNESMSKDSYFLDKVAAQKLGFNWQDNLPGTTGQETVKWGQISDDIEKVDDSILKEILACEKCAKNYKLVRQEFDYYKKRNIPVPRNCFECRRQDRRGLRNVRKLYDRQCMHEKDGERCQNKFQTTYQPDSTEIVYCAECFREEIY